jgi:hypothetical protein
MTTVTLSCVARRQSVEKPSAVISSPRTGRRSSPGCRRSHQSTLQRASDRRATAPARPSCSPVRRSSGSSCPARRTAVLDQLFGGAQICLRHLVELVDRRLDAFHTVSGILEDQLDEQVSPCAVVLRIGRIAAGLLPQVQQVSERRPVVLQAAIPSGQRRFAMEDLVVGQMRAADVVLVEEILPSQTSTVMEHRTDPRP